MHLSFFNGFPPNLYFSSHSNGLQPKFSLRYRRGCKAWWINKMSRVFSCLPPYKRADKLKSPVTLGKVGQRGPISMQILTLSWELMQLGNGKIKNLSGLFLVLESYLLQFNYKGGFSLKASVDTQSAVSYSVNNKIQCWFHRISLVLLWAFFETMCLWTST